MRRFRLLAEFCCTGAADHCHHREEARSIIQRGVNAGAEHAVLFTGSGATGASCKLCALMQLLPQWKPLPVVLVSSLEHHSNILPWRESGAVVLTVGPSRIIQLAIFCCAFLSVSLPFPSFGSAAPASDSCIDILHLTQQLQRACDMGASIIIGAFAAGALSDITPPRLLFILSAASNVSGALAEVHAVTAVLHAHSALAGAAHRHRRHYPPFLFFAPFQFGITPPPPLTFTCSLQTPHSNTSQHERLMPPSPHVCQIKRTRTSQVSLFPHPPPLFKLLTLMSLLSRRGIDALIISPHKFNGGPGSPGTSAKKTYATALHFVIPTTFPGVLVIRKSLITHSRPPTQPGGGTVYFVSSQHVRYMPVAEEREEAGTPNTLGCVRAGLAFALKVGS